jgi:aryl-alcohol dehydrogenase-like predicted oxidoreductase
MVARDTVELGTLNVRRLGFGTMQLTGPGVWGPPADHDGAINVLRRAVQLGVNLIDTADSYGPNVAEELVREALFPYSDGLTLATKAGFTRSGPNQWTECGKPDYLRAQCEGSLQRLGVERIDLFQLHRIDPNINADDQVSVGQIEAARRIVPIVSVQNLYNIAQRDADDVVNHCEALRIGFIPWFPLGSGKLTALGGPLDTIASELGATVSQVSLAWLLRRSPIMLPIPGTSSLQHLDENCRAADIALSDDAYQQLTESRKTIRRWAMSN